MDGYDLTASLVNSVTSAAWPVAAFGCFFLVRKELRELIAKLKSVNFGDKQMSFLSEIVEKTREDTVELMIEQPSTVLENLTSLSNGQLKQRVSEFAAQIRQWSHETRLRRDAVLYDRHGRENWDEYTQRVLENSNEQHHTWRSEYQSSGLALKTELLRRVTDLEGIDLSLGDTAIDHGMLAGVSPVTDAAILLETLARRLPQ